MINRVYLIQKTLYPDFNSARCLLSNQETGHADPIGQILIQMGHNPDKMRIPSELKQHIPPFTNKVRGRIVDTHYTLQLLAAFQKNLLLRDDAIEKLLKQHFKVEIT